MKRQLRFTQSGLMWLWLAVLVVVVDHWSKLWVVNNLSPHQPFTILPIFDLTLAYNTGAAFSFLHAMSGWQNWLLGGLAVVVSITILIWLSRTAIRDYVMNMALCLILGGALGNAWDRVVYGYVIDFLSFHWQNWYFAIFNLADSAICLGAFLLCWHWFRKSK